MGLMSFIKEAGEKLFGKGQAQAAAKPSEADQAVATNQAASDAIVDYIRKMDLDAEGLSIAFDGDSGEVTVSGMAKDQATKEKILLCCGNVAGVAKVNDAMSVANPADGADHVEAQYYVVVKGDTLSKIAKQHYGDANAYPKIFEANKPMLTHPDKIYPGQTLRIPPN